MLGNRPFAVNADYNEHLGTVKLFAITRVVVKVHIMNELKGSEH